MLTRALVVWFGLLVLAFANGTLREIALIPHTGDAAGHAISSVMLSAAIFGLSWFTILWVHPTSTMEAWTIGGMWLALTLAFEFLAGHYVFGNSWNVILADYNVWRGRLWVLVLVTTLCAPFITARGH